MTERFKKAMAHVFKHEGGYNDIKEDAGGATNYGVSLRFLKSINEDVNNDGKVDWLDIKKLTKNDAMDIYYDNFWRPLYDALPERLSLKLFDVSVNAGHSRSHILLQRALNKLGSKLACDGMVGKVTMSECAKYAEKDVLKAYVDVQIDFYNELVRIRPANAKFIKGWTNRAKWIPA
jgi:lysozyme family protein